MKEGEGKPLAVSAAGGETVASRARFDVRMDESKVKVTCCEGMVAVKVESAEVKLRAGQQVSYDEQGLGPVSAVDIGVATAWQRGLLLFRDAPLSKVVEEVNRYRPGKIILLDSALAGRTVIAGFRLDQIDDVVPYITRVFGARARYLLGGIVLIS